MSRASPLAVRLIGGLGDDDMISSPTSTVGCAERKCDAEGMNAMPLLERTTVGAPPGEEDRWIEEAPPAEASDG